MPKAKKNETLERGESFETNNEFVKAVLNQDGKYDNDFVLACIETGFACRPSCGKFAAKYNKSNEDYRHTTRLTERRLYNEFCFFKNMGQALKKSYKPCKRCFGREKPIVQHYQIKYLALLYVIFMGKRSKWSDHLEKVTNKHHNCREFKFYENKTFLKWLDTFSKWFLEFARRFN